MPRLTDELRRITREQGGSRADSEEGTEEEVHARRSPLGIFLLLLGIVLLAGVGWVLVRQLIADSRLQDCVMSGRKNCVPVDPSGQ